MQAATAAPTDFDDQLTRLLGRCAMADARALHELYDLVSPVLFACLIRILKRRALAEEVLQDVFVAIWQRAAQFQADRGRPMTWMISIARYRSIDLLRHERDAPVLVPEIPEHGNPDDEEKSSSAWLPPAGLFERCIELLSEPQRHCLELAFVDGSSHEEIAQLTGSPLGTVKSWIRRGLQSLKQCLES